MKPSIWAENLYERGGLGCLYHSMAWVFIMVVFIKALAGFNNIIYAILMLEVVNREDFSLVIL